MRPTRAINVCTLMIVAAAATLGADLRSRVYVTGVTAPVAFVQDPGDRAIQFVVQQNGRIRVVRNGAVLAADFLDVSSAIVSGGEQGLLGLAFAPDTAITGRFYVQFTNRSGHIVIARFRRADAVTADPSSRFDLRWSSAGGQRFIPHPFANHNGGHLLFGPDGYLYIGLGDGGSGGDPDHRAQNPSELLGKMLRIDGNVPDSDPTGYQIPSDNPFVGSRPIAASPEIWAFGLRNPWRYSFDDSARGGNGALLIADVGQGAWEEIDYEPANRGGRNYGWRLREGAHNYDTSRPAAFQPLVEPIHEYSHAVGQSIIGGFVYRGAALGAAFRGRYFFADFVRGRVWSLALTIDPSSREATASDVREHTDELGGASQLGSISSFGVDADGELYVVGYSLGRIVKIVGPPSVPSGLRIIR